MAKALEGKVALVTGGSRGIGAAIAQRLASEGAAVALTYASSEEKAAEVVDAIKAGGGKALAIRADGAYVEALKEAVAEAARSLGRLDILVNNAGIYVTGTLDEFSVEDFDRLYAVNVRAVFVAAQEAARHMGEGGRIITIGSCVAERMPFPGGAPYTMSKSAVAGLTRGLARDLGPRGITVNNVQPGPVDTDMNPSDGASADAMRGAMALGRYGQADEIAAMVAYLAGPDAGFVTGANLTIDGGFST